MIEQKRHFYAFLHTAPDEQTLFAGVVLLFNSKTQRNQYCKRDPESRLALDAMDVHNILLHGNSIIPVAYYDAMYDKVYIYDENKTLSWRDYYTRQHTNHDD